jgi:chromosome segregation and condensation protein ScpB
MMNNVKEVMEIMQGGARRKDLNEHMDVVRVLIEDGLVMEVKPAKKFQPYIYILTEKGQELSEMEGNW